jgi:uncharacterized protein YwqG
VTELEKLVEEFALNVAAQTDASWKGDSRTGNKHARRYIAAFEKLREHGDAGRERLATLFTHPRMDVRVSAAAYLLRYRTAEARTVLEEAAKGKGLVPFEASLVLKNWENGTWALDPAEDARTSPPAPPQPEPAPPPRPRVVKTRAPAPRGLKLPRVLQPHRALLEGMLAPCIHFDKEEGAPRARGCRLGGLPLVPPGTPWPHAPEGPLHFLGQLDFEELTSCRGEALPGFPASGLLAFFYDVEKQPWGREPEDHASWRLIWTPGDAEVVTLQPPEELMESERSILPPWRLIPSSGVSLQHFSDRDAPAELESLSEAASEAYLALMERLAGGEFVHQVGGHPAWVQEDARAEAQLVSHGLRLASAEAWDTPEAKRLEPAASEWRLLWQVASDEELELMWGSSMGTLYLLIRDEDLRARRFERAWLILQCS